MMDRHTLFFWSWPIGKLFGAEIRLSWMMPFIGLVYCLQGGWQLGLTLFLVTLVAVLLHEYGHVFVARGTGGNADEIVLSPWGGLAAAQPGPGLWAQFFTAGAGPLVNLVLCALVFPAWYAPELTVPALIPSGRLPIDRIHGDKLAADLMLLTFIASWLLLLINLLPIYPFDGGQMLQALLSSRLPPDLVFRGMTYTSFCTAIALMLIGLVMQWSWLILLGAIVLVINVIQSMQGHQPEFQDESFMGYDFSQGYTSLERSTETVSGEPPRSGGWQEWKERRRQQREEETRQRQLQDEQQLDDLLAKVHQHGIDSLSPAEHRVLQRVSGKYRDRTKRPT